ncbi:serine-rich adhesin for platelets-like [Anopheles albimanus]|uniref:Uncharacterized protein n=1 Tax=Anopheles albimanus TaxID=7167 RepID=A0A182FGE9_ANOAL|nr:serine-rich adhesin for platelets-like [Anopheles albimanus]
MSGDCKMVGEGSLAMLKGKPWHAFIELTSNRSIFDTEEEESDEATYAVGGEHGQRSTQGSAITGQPSHHPQKQPSFPGSSILAGSATDRGSIPSRPRGSVMRLDRADMGLYGICPETDPFYAVICDICESVVKPQGLQKHMSNRHHSHYHHAAKLNANGNTSSSTAGSGALNSVGSTVTTGSVGNGNLAATSAGSGNRSIANDQQLLTGTAYVSSGEKTDYRSSSAAETLSRTDASKLSSSSSSSLSLSVASSFSGPGSAVSTSSSGRSGHQGESDAGGANLESGSLAVPQSVKVRSSGSGKTKSKNAKSTHSSKSSSGTTGYGSSGTLSSSFAKATIAAPTTDGGSTMSIPLADFGGAIGSGGVPVVLMSNCSVVPDKKATFPIASDGSSGASTKSLSTKRASKQTSSSSSSSSPSSSSSSSSSYSSSNSSNSTSSSSHSSSSSSSSNSFSSSNTAAQHKFSGEKKSERSRDFDPDRHCGVATPDGKRHCTKPLTSCKSHSLSQRRAVTGRSKHLDKLIAELRTPGVAKELENTSGSSGVFLEAIESSSNSSTSFDAADRRMAATGSGSGGTGVGSGDTTVRSKTPSTVSATDSSAHGGRTSSDGMVKLLHAPSHRSASPASHKTGTSSEGKSERSKHKQSSRSSHVGSTTAGGTTGQSHGTNKSSSHHRSGSSSTKHGGQTRDSSSSSAAVTTAAPITHQPPPPIVVTSQASQQAMLQSSGSQQHQQLLQQPASIAPQQSLLLTNAPTEMLAQHYALGESSNTVLTDHTTIMMDPGSNLLKLAVSPGALQSTVETGEGSHQQPYTASSAANVNMMQDQLTVTLPLSVINSMNLSGTSLVNMAHGCGDGSLPPNASSGVLPNTGPTGTTLLATGVDAVEPQHTAEAFIPAELIEQLPLVAANGTDPNTAYRLAAAGNAGTGMSGTTITTGGVSVDDGGLADLATLPNFNEQINYTLQTVLAQNLQSAEGTAELVDSIDDIVPTISLLPSAANPLVIPQLQGELGDSIILTPTQLTTLSQSLVDQHFIDNMTLKSAEMEIGLTVNGPVDIPSKLMLLRKVDEEFIRERQQQQQSALPYQARAGQMLDDMRGIRMWYSALPKPLHVNTFQLRRLAGGFVMNRKLLALRKNLLTEASLLGAGVTGTGSTGSNQQQNNSPGATVVGRSASASGDILLSSLSSIGKSKLGGMGEGSGVVGGAGGGTNGTVAGINVGSPMMGSPTGSGGGIGIRSGNTAPVNRGQRRMLIAHPRTGPFAGERSEKPSCLLSNTYFRNLITSMQQQQQPSATNAKEGMTLVDSNSLDRLHSLKRGASSLTTLSNKRLKIINNLHNSTAPPQMLLQGSSCKMKPKVL